MLPTDLLLNPAVRVLVAAALGIAYAALCLGVYRRELQCRRRKSALETAAADGLCWLVAYASQTGEAEALAIEAAQRLHQVGVSVQVKALNQLATDQLLAAERALFVVSTYGEGDPPDDGALFASHALSKELDLSQLRYALLALGDDSYLHYCGFGRALDAWLLRCSAQAMHSRIEVSRGNAEALTRWQALLGQLGGSSDAAERLSSVFSSWRLRQRRLLNPGSLGEALYELELVPADGVLPQWLSGDLVQLCVPGEEVRPREYSIASLPSEGCVRLLVRLHRDAQGRVGRSSGWLSQAAIGSAVQLRVRVHRKFRLSENAERPLILIGNGSGLAGLRGHIYSRAKTGQYANWLIYGERNKASDSIWGGELEAWCDRGALQRLDRTFSRDGGPIRYVQDVLLNSAEAVHEWMSAGAAIYVCGSLKGMATGVEQALSELLGEKELQALRLSGRYRRDIY